MWKRVLIGLVVIMLLGVSTPVLSQALFPERCNNPSNFFSCLRFYNAIPDQGAILFVEGQRRGYAPAGGTVFTDVSPGVRTVGAYGDKGQSISRKITFEAGKNETWCIFYTEQAVPEVCRQ